ncbi:carboxypeptidase regulatory-like domain-containing protein [Imperialibacter roseus]|uniref:Carboxypeptidase regulatory-like domain-containing protein n=1 Tax=Imperialibacter roseus TaxID=1324217 RepID=A0ABZ0IJ41_9BACT|nr:carboxypeptidase regulatory-like domain-containing protein [Imperialibacter roseus]WOK05038.1 carboxypeptidase regulatory-like domain-containing protein [Imperialibacter roseus]
MKSLLIIGFLLAAVGCKSSLSTTSEKQGVTGAVYWMEGDFMPRIGEKPGGSRQPIVREILFYAPINASDLAGDHGPLYESLPGEPIAQTGSGENGRFRISLPVGTYSVFTKEPDGFFANRFDSNGIINPVEVKAGAFSEIVIEINYKAVF